MRWVFACFIIPDAWVLFIWVLTLTRRIWITLLHDHILIFIKNWTRLTWLLWYLWNYWHVSLAWDRGEMKLILWQLNWQQIDHLWAILIDVVIIMKSSYTCDCFFDALRCTSIHYFHSISLYEIHWIKDYWLLSGHGISKSPLLWIVMRCRVVTWDWPVLVHEVLGLDIHYVPGLRRSNFSS